MKYFLSCFAVSSLLLSLSACSKHAGDVAPAPESAGAVLTVAYPTVNAVYRNGDTVRVIAQAIAPNTIHGYEVGIYPASDSTQLYYTHVHDHNDTLRIDQYWVNDRTAAQSLEARITLTLDHEGHQLVRRIPFRVQ